MLRMNKLSTIQKRENLNDVYAGEKGVGGASHDYMIVKAGCAKYDEKDETLTVNPDDIIETIHFQEGARKSPEAMHGVVDQDLLEIVRDRLRGFQSGDMPTRETACALTCVEEALMWLNKRIEDRIERNVLGTYKK
jgi:hypothetical protein